MIMDARHMPEGETLRTKLAIIGAGPAGITLALGFVKTGIDVVLVAGGALDYDAASQALYAGEVVDDALHSPPDTYRQRRYGGASAIWGGRVMPFDPIDFEPRPWIEGADWPIPFSEITRFYAEANRLAEAGDCDYNAKTALDGGMRPMIAGFQPQAFDADAIERFSCPTDFAKRYGHQLAKAGTIRVITHAHAVEIVKTAHGRISHVELRRLEGGAFRLEADEFVLATGGLETARLLLASQAQDAHGLGNAHDLVGRHYMCHIAGTMGALHVENAESRVWHGYERAWDGVYCRRRLALKPEIQRAHETGNVVMRLHHPRLPDAAHGRGILSAIYLAKPFIAFEYAKRLHSAEMAKASSIARHMLNIAREPFGTAAFLVNWLRLRTFAARKFPSLVVAPRNGVFSLDIHAEQVPNRESRVMLSEKADAFGKPQIKVDWRCKPQDIRTVRVALAALKADIARLEGASLTYDDAEIEPAMLRDGAYGGHHIGTARMGKTPKDGVVDKDCKLFGVENLYIAGSAAFPTSGQANPTLTIIAFALRLAEHLKAKIAPSPPGIETGRGESA